MHRSRLPNLCLGEFAELRCDQAGGVAAEPSVFPEQSEVAVADGSVEHRFD